MLRSFPKEGIRYSGKISDEFPEKNVMITRRILELISFQTSSTYHRGIDEIISSGGELHGGTSRRIHKDTSGSISAETSEKLWNNFTRIPEKTFGQPRSSSWKSSPRNAFKYFQKKTRTEISGRNNCKKQFPEELLEQIPEELLEETMEKVSKDPGRISRSNLKEISRKNCLISFQRNSRISRKNPENKCEVTFGGSRKNSWKFP